MKTLMLGTSADLYEESINKASKILCDGGIVAIPTETVYGLAASAYSDGAIKKVFTAKGRPQDNPLIVHIAETEMLYEIAVDIPDKALECAKKFWPGPLTMVLKRTDKIAPSVSAGLDTVAVRMPSEKVARDIIRTSNLPLAAPSANTSGAPSPTAYSHVYDDLNGKIDAIVCGGNCAVGVESTVISLVGEKPRLLRPGAVTLEALREILPDIEVDRAVLSKPEDNARVASPGMKYKHYAPKTETYLVEGTDDRFCEFVNSKASALAVCFEEESEKITVEKTVYGSKNDESTLAKSIFGVLREADLKNVQEIYVHAPSKSGVGLAVYNRLIRAAAYKVICL